MKNNKIIYLLSFVVMLAASCKDDFLEEKRDLSGVNEEVFQDPLLARSYVDYVYGLFLPGNNGTPWIQTQSASENGTYNSVFTQTTEELAGETDFNKPWPTISYQNNHANKYFGQRMGKSVNNNTWTRLRQINIFLNEIDKHGIDEATRDVLKGQMYFWRAWQYFELVRLYGGVPLVVTPQNPILTDVEENAIPRSSTSESIKQITADLDSAISMLPGKYTSTADWGRITSGAAAALKGRVLLTWASPLFNRNDQEARWAEAYQANVEAKTLLEENGFGLYKVGNLANGEAWGKMFLAEGSANPEAVMVFGFNNMAAEGNGTKNSGWEQAVRPRQINGNGSVSPTLEAMEAFPMKDGKMIGDASSAYTYDLQTFYKNRDPRFYQTFVYNGAPWPYGSDPNYKHWTYVWKKDAASTQFNASTETAANASGIYVKKASNPTASSTSNGSNFSQSGTDYMEIRFAEVLLNLAECEIGTNRLNEGIEHIKEIRGRAGVENLDGDYGLSAARGDRDKLFAAVLNERRVEFAYEAKRFWDLRRWLLFDDTYGTVSRLGMEELNGTRRHGVIVSVKTSETGADYVGTENPFLPRSNGTYPLINRNPATYPDGIADYNAYLDYLYTNYFEVSVKDDLDRTNATPAWTFKWYPEYYFFGLNQTILSTSPYLEQTKGWDSLNGMGTFDPLL